MLDDVDNVAVYSVHEVQKGSWHRPQVRKYFHTSSSETLVCMLSLGDLGLGAGCHLERVWAGDGDKGVPLLHVLYSVSKHQQFCLATYHVKEKCFRDGPEQVELQ